MESILGPAALVFVVLFFLGCFVILKMRKTTPRFTPDPCEAYERRHSPDNDGVCDRCGRKIW